MLSYCAASNNLQFSCTNSLSYKCQTFLNPGQCWSATYWTLACLQAGDTRSRQNRRPVFIKCFTFYSESEHSRWGFCPRSGWCHPDSLLLSASRRGCRCSMWVPPSSPGRSVVWTQICAASLSSRPTCAQCCEDRKCKVSHCGFFHAFQRLRLK